MTTPEQKEIEVKWPSPLPPSPPPCSFNQCVNGHKWPITLATAECPGCKAQIVVTMMQQCPVCNDATVTSSVRVDHVMKGGGVSAQCQGQKNLAEVTVVEMTRTHSIEIEEKMKDGALVEHAHRKGGIK